jgi:hypothetical protein
METSKKLAWLAGICFLVAIIYSILIFTYSIVTDKMCDCTVLVTLITVTGAAFGTTCAFYYNKSKGENLFKMKFSFLQYKYQILRDMDAFTEEYMKEEVENEVDKIECDLDEKEDYIAEDITYNVN